MSLRLAFSNGTLLLLQLPEAAKAALKAWIEPDPASQEYRALAYRYREIVLKLRSLGIPYVDEARAFGVTPFPFKEPFRPYQHQAAALKQWIASQKRGTVELPTGAGKTRLAVLAIEATQRPTLVLVPTLELLFQWQAVLEAQFGMKVGVLGGGQHEVLPITVSTYPSASLHIEHLGARFGLLIADECHHLPAPAYRFIAEASLAPFRLGLSATVERSDGLESVGYALLGPLVYKASIDRLEGKYLAPYEVIQVPVALSEAEQEAYEASRAEYIAFLRNSGVNLAEGGWQSFVMLAHQSPEGRSAFKAYRRQRRIALGAKAKLDALWEILLRHADDRVLVFTDDNESVYSLSARFMAPAITHQTGAAERKRLLSAFSSGECRLLFAAKVLNEGVDVPEANVGVVLSGSGSVREHVQRLGRILRKRPGKAAILYEVTTEVAAELGMSERRRQHEAYQRGDLRLPEAAAFDGPDTQDTEDSQAKDRPC